VLIAQTGAQSGRRPAVPSCQPTRLWPQAKDVRIVNVNLNEIRTLRPPMNAIPFDGTGVRCGLVCVSHALQKAEIVRCKGCPTEWKCEIQAALQKSADELGVPGTLFRQFDP
jgi:hypothetical protein